eukprot:m51a1_g3368 hypothetical protein (131) ;mRNA; f:452961-454549
MGGHTTPQTFGVNSDTLAPGEGFFTLFHNFDITHPFVLKGAFRTSVEGVIQEYTFSCSLLSKDDDVLNVEARMAEGGTALAYEPAIPMPIFLDHNYSAIGGSVKPTLTQFIFERCRRLVPVASGTLQENE